MPAKPAKPAASVLVLMGTVPLGLYLLCSHGQHQRAETEPVKPERVFSAQDPPAAEAAVLLRAAPAPRRHVESPNGEIRLPGGVYVPALNGVDTPMTWGDRPFSPIVGLNVTDAGVQWYVHENGMQSTTIGMHGQGPGAKDIKTALLLAKPDYDSTRPLKPGIPR